MPTSRDHDARMDRARLSLAGLSVGDAFGERFFTHADVVEGLIRSWAISAPPWRFIDDTRMALSVVELLGRHGGIEQDDLARSFATRYDGARGYGPAMHGLLARIRAGEHWSEASPSLFDGEGTFGNESPAHPSVRPDFVTRADRQPQGKNAFASS